MGFINVKMLSCYLQKETWIWKIEGSAEYCHTLSRWLELLDIEKDDRCLEHFAIYKKEEKGDKKWDD